MNKGGKLAVATLSLALAAMSLAGCNSASGDKQIVATTTVLGSIVKQIADCAGAKSVTLMGPGADPHDFAPSSAQVAEMTKATLVVANGGGLEGGMTDVLKNVQKDGAKVYEVLNDVDPIPFEDHDAEEGDHQGEEHHHGDKDPHFWNDGARGAKAAEKIGVKLAAETGNAKFSECGNKLRDDITKVNEDIKKQLATVPESRRILITDHEALGYFAKAYGFEIAGVVIPGGGTSGEPSSAEIAKLVSVIKDKKVPAIFSNTSLSSKVVETVAKESGTQVKVVPLFVESLGDDASGVTTYQKLLKTNAQRVTDALK